VRETTNIVLCCSQQDKKIWAAWEMLFLFRAAKNQFLSTISCSWNVQVRSTVQGLQKTLTLGI
jgi:hypothetical protein